MARIGLYGGISLGAGGAFAPRDPSDGGPNITGLHFRAGHDRRRMGGIWAILLMLLAL